MTIHCYPYYANDGFEEYCEHTNKRLIDAEPEALKGKILYDTGSRCPQCGNLIIRIPF